MSKLQRIKREYHGEGIHLLKHKSKGGFLSVVFSRFGICFMLFMAQATILALGFTWLSDFHLIIHSVNGVLAIGLTFYLLNSDMNPSAKITWLIIMAVMPVFGILLFAYIQSDIGHRVLKKTVSAIAEETENDLPQNMAAMNALREENPGAASLATYIRSTGNYPVFRDNEITYYPLGDDFFPELLEELEKARDYIFIEFFIIAEGIMWGNVLEVLAKKAAEGVDVRVIYDGTNEFRNLPSDYPKRLEALGIKCRVFSPMTPFLSTHYNYRDHRKIVAIDSRVAFTGGVNLADEYINRQLRFGHWKDNAVKVVGDAARSFALMFLETWAIADRNIDYQKYLTPAEGPHYAEGYAVPYADCPLDKHKTGKMVYIDLLNRAQRYVHIMTPYLIIDGELSTALRFAAERGVDVSIILPAVPDKKLPFALAKTHYRQLLEAGVKIYEYTPGFIHSKSMVMDGKEAVVGSINLDYRSLYHHFECAIYMVGSPCIADAEDDFRETVAKCRRVTPSTIWKGSESLRLLGAVMKAIAPLF